MGTRLLGYMGQLERLSDISQKIFTRPTVINTQVNKYSILFEVLNYGSTIKSYFHAFSTTVKGKNVRRKRISIEFFLPLRFSCFNHTIKKV